MCGRHLHVLYCSLCHKYLVPGPPSDGWQWYAEWAGILKRAGSWGHRFSSTKFSSAVEWVGRVPKTSCDRETATLASRTRPLTGNLIS